MTNMNNWEEEFKEEFGKDKDSVYTVAFTSKVMNFISEKIFNTKAEMFNRLHSAIFDDGQISVGSVKKLLEELKKIGKELEIEFEELNDKKS